jgi:acetyl-CoA C-acetyltransferase
VYSTAPAPWRTGSDAAIQAGIDSSPSVVSVRNARGWIRVETYTVKHTRTGLVGIVVGRLENSGERVVATTVEDDGLSLLVEGEPIGRPMFVAPADQGNRVHADSATPT